MKNVIIIIGLLLAITTVSQAATQYTITDLGTLGGNDSYSDNAVINDSGQVAGRSHVGPGGYSHAFLYENGVMKDIGTLGGLFSYAWGINNNGQVVGHSYTSVGDNTQHAFLFDGTSMVDLGTLGGTDSTAMGINDRGKVAGYSQISGNSAFHAFLLNGTSMIDLGTLGGTSSFGRAINNNGWAVGQSQLAGDYGQHAFLYNGNSMIDLGTLGGHSSVAYAINNNGWVVGESHLTGESATHAFLHNGNSMIDLGILGGTYSIAKAINDIGQVVGVSNGRAFLYEEINGMLDLNNLIPSGSGWILSEASDINYSGQIVGHGIIDSQTHAFLLTPIPEPCSLLLLAVGGLLLRRRK